MINSSALCQVNVYNIRDIRVEGSSGEVTVFFEEHELSLVSTNCLFFSHLCFLFS